MLSTLLLAALSSAVSAAPILKVGTVLPSTLPNATQYNASVVNYYMNGNAGACGRYNKDSDKVVGLPLEFYSKLGEVSPYCGEYIIVTNALANISVLAQVEDASTLNNTLSVSQGTWAALNGSESDLHLVNWRRANETEIAAAKKSQSSAPSSTSTYVAPSSTSVYVAPSSSSASKEWKAPSSSSSAAEHSSTWTPSSSTSSAEKSSWTPSSSASSSWSSSSVAEKKSSSTWVPSSSAEKSTWSPSSSAEKSIWTPSSSSSSPAVKWTPSSTWSPEPTTTSKWTPTTTTQAAKKTQEASTSSFSGSYSGQATWFTQNGAPGSCGNYNSDYTNLVALNAPMVGSMGNKCGSYVTIKNTANGRSTTAIVADTCPGCGWGSLDLSLSAFDALGSRDSGVLPITWSFN